MTFYELYILTGANTGGFPWYRLRIFARGCTKYSEWRWEQDAKTPSEYLLNSVGESTLGDNPIEMNACCSC